MIRLLAGCVFSMAFLSAQDAADWGELLDQLEALRLEQTAAPCLLAGFANAQTAFLVDVSLDELFIVYMHVHVNWAMTPRC